MDLYKTIMALGSAAYLGLVGCCELTGSCDEKTTPPSPTPQKSVRPDYFAAFPIGPRYGVALTNGDFDGDGDLDFIVATYAPPVGDYPLNEKPIPDGKLYFLENDGKGNFTPRKVPKQLQLR